MSLFGILPLEIPKDFEMASLPVEKVKVQKLFALISRIHVGSFT